MNPYVKKAAVDRGSERQTMKAVLYMRYSSNSQTEQSIEGQRRICREYAQREDLQIIDEYIDRATSASHDIQKRTAFLRMIEDAKRHKFEAVIVYKLDRFARDRYDSAVNKRILKQNGVKLLSATEPISDRPEGALMESMLEGMAEYYSLELAQKINRGINESVQKRQFLGGRVPLGFKVENKKLVPDPVTAPLVRRLYDMVLEGRTYKDMVKYLTDNGIRGRNGKPLSASSLTNLFRSKRNIGYYCYKDIEEPGATDPIVDPEVFEAVQRRLRMTARKHHDNTDYLLSGKLFCGQCGMPMNGEKGRSKNGDYYYYYTCRGRKKGKGCMKKPIRKDVIETVVVEKALDMLNDETIEKIIDMMMDDYRENYLNNSPIKEIEEQIREVEKLIENGLNAVLSGFGSKALARKLDDLETQKEQLDRRLQDLKDNQLILTPDMIRYYLEQVKGRAIDTEEGRKRLIETFIRKVVLFDEGDENNGRMQIVYNLSGYSDDVDLFDLRTDSSTIVNGDEHYHVMIDAMVVIVNYILRL